VVPDASCGQWWRIHDAANGAWWFASSDSPARAEHDIGRFDLPAPDGTCYLAEDLAAGGAESLREVGVTAAQAQRAANERNLSQMPLDRWYGKRIADFTAPTIRRHGLPVDIAALDRSVARPWALAARRGGFYGILYRLREDPERRRGLALFHDAGEYAPVDQPFPQPIVVGIRHDLVALFDGEYRGDPLFK
jgi:RES domain